MSNKLYTSIPAPKVPRNTFNRSRPNTLTMPFQRLVPMALEEIYPGDIYRCNPEVFARLQPMIAPVMNNMKISTHFFFVPLRTLNKHFAEFMFNNRTGDYSGVLPYTHTDVLYNVVASLAQSGVMDEEAMDVIRLYDYIGLPFRYSSAASASALVTAWLADSYNLKVKAAAVRINLCPFFAYQKIWSEYFRDENVTEDPFEYYEDNVGENVLEWTGDCDNGVTTTFALHFLLLRRRAWAHDRFTSCLPFAQRGPDVLLPIAGQVDVTYKTGFTNTDVSGAGQGKIKYHKPGNPSTEETRALVISGSSSSYTNLSVGANADATRTQVAYDPNGSLEVDFDNAALTTTINSFRRAERLQRWYENSARGGVRPNEATLAHFGIRTPDATLDRAEYLGGSKQPIVVSEVAQTSETTASSPQGTLAGKGTSYKSNPGFKAFFTEHGYVFGFVSALVRANYWQGVPKVFSRMQRDEYYWPEFANLGEEPVFTKELYLDSTVTEDAVFGYVPRYSDLKSATGELHGDMRSSLSFWTQARQFSNKPALNETFLFNDPSLSPFAVQSLASDPIICTVQLHVKASRLMPFYGVPTI